MGRLDEINARTDAATPGPWKRDRSWWITGPDHIWDHPDEAQRGTGYHHQCICQINGPAGALNHAPADQDFIIGAREDVPWLLEEVARLRAVVDAADLIIADARMYQKYSFSEHFCDLFMQELSGYDVARAILEDAPDETR